MAPSSLLASVVLLVSSLYVYASPLAGRQQPGSDPNIMIRGLGGNGPIPVDNGNNDMYTVNITLGGEEFIVQLDTGSTDLWVDGRGRNIKATNTTGIPGNQSYGRGEASGVISFAELKVGEYTVSSQAFLNASEVQDMSPGMQGILGMAVGEDKIYQKLKEAWGEAATDERGRSFINNVFALNKSLPNSFDVQLGRQVLDVTGDSSLVIASHLPEYENVTQAPKLPRVGSVYWSIYVDEMHVDGKQVPFNQSHIQDVPEGKIIAALDTGYSLPALPSGAVDAIYSNIPGAVLYNTTDEGLRGWIIPCNGTELPELSFTFSGKQYLVHPLDLFRLVPVANVSYDGKVEPVYICAAAYQASTLDPTRFSVDSFLGDAFLRSVYASFEYGDANAANQTGEGGPFVQMVSTVDPSAAQNEYKDFVQKTKDLRTLQPLEFVSSRLEGSGSN